MKGAQSVTTTLYKAVWTNFSYMVLIAGGLLTFASGHLLSSVIFFIASLPLIFWYWATFLPMNLYGDQVGDRLMWIEKVVNYQFNLGFDHSDLGQHSGLKHFSDFHTRSPAWKVKPWGVGRVRTVVNRSAVLLHLLALACLVFAGYQFYKTGSLESAPVPTIIQLAKDSKPSQIGISEASKPPSPVLTEPVNQQTKEQKQ